MKRSVTVWFAREDSVVVLVARRSHFNYSIKNKVVLQLQSETKDAGHETYHGHVASYSARVTCHSY